MNLLLLGKEIKKEILCDNLISVFSFSHADGSIKFWDASGCSLVFLYKLRTNRLFDRIQSSNPNPPMPSTIQLTSIKFLSLILERVKEALNIITNIPLACDKINTLESYQQAVLRVIHLNIF